jgi:hypothetical protein
LYSPRGLAFDAQGGLWISEYSSHRVRRIWKAPSAVRKSLSLTVTSGDEQTVYPSEQLEPWSFKVTETNGTPVNGLGLSIANEDASVHVPPLVTNFEGNAVTTARAGYAPSEYGGEVQVKDVDGKVVARKAFGYTVATPPDGTITSVVNALSTGSPIAPKDGAIASISSAYGTGALATGSDGSIFYTYSNQVYAVRPSGRIELLAGDGNIDFASEGPVLGTSQYLYSQPSSLASDWESDQLYIAAPFGSEPRVYQLDLDTGVLAILMGHGTDTASGSPAASTQLTGTVRVAVGASGVVYVNDQVGLWSIDPNAAPPRATRLQTYVANCSTEDTVGKLYNYGQYHSITTDPDGALYYVGYRCSALNTSATVWAKITGANTFTVIRSPFVNPYDIDLAMDAAGNIYLEDSSAPHRVRRITPAGNATTVAGTGVAGKAGDFGPATQAQLYSPQGVAFLPNGDIVIADYYNNAIRRVWGP